MKIKICLIIILLGLSILPACNQDLEDDQKIDILCTIFPEYDWVKEITAGVEDVNLELLIDNGVDFHSYQGTFNDIIKIKNCDILIMVGGESDRWINEAIINHPNDNRKVINLFEVLSEVVKEETITDEDHDEHDHESDEHLWLSIKNAKKVVEAITKVLAEIDQENAEVYNSNTLNYLHQLETLDQSFQEMINESSYDTVIIADRFPFLYLFDDYNIKYYAAFPGCSAEIEASLSTVMFLKDKVDELNIKTILIVDNSNLKLAQTIKNNSSAKDQEIKSLNSMQSVTTKDIDSGTTYISIMEENLRILEVALGKVSK